LKKEKLLACSRYCKNSRWQDDHTQTSLIDTMTY